MFTFYVFGYFQLEKSWLSDSWTDLKQIQTIWLTELKPITDAELYYCEWIIIFRCTLFVN